MSRSVSRLAPLPVLFGIAFGVGCANESQALESRIFIISVTSGVEECLGDGGECGRGVADAWCYAHGQGVALKFGRSEDTAAAPNASLPAPKRYYVTCGE
jgi:hypothetical protein